MKVEVNSGGIQTRSPLFYRESIILALGLFDRWYTKQQLYRFYSRLYQRFHGENFVEFNLPSKSLFYQMLKKLMSQGIIEEIYHNQNYVLQLTPIGRGTYEVIISNLESHPDYTKLINIIGLYNGEVVT